jgi:putative transposase
VPRTRPPYPEEFRREAIRLAQLGDKPQHRLAKDLGISDVTLRNWIKQDKAERGERPGGLRQKQPPSSQRRATGGRRGVLVHRRGEGHLPVAVMCRVLGVNHTSFHDWERRPPSDRALTDVWLTEKVKQIHEASRGV